MAKPKVCALIPARFDSTRFPGKPLAEILGIPMIVRVASICEIAVGPDATFVVTDDERIARVCREHNIKYIITHGSFETGTDRIASVIGQIPGDIFLNVQGDEPCISPKDIRAAIDEKIANPETVINGYCPVELRADIKNFSIPKVVVSNTGKLLYISRANIPANHKLSNSEHPQEYLRQVCIYAYSREELLAFREAEGRGHLEAKEDIEIIRFLERDMNVKMIPMSYSIAVDYPEDIVKVCEFINAGHKLEKN